MELDSSSVTEEQLHFNGLQALLKKYKGESKFSKRDDVQILPMNLDGQNNELIAMVHTTTNDLLFQYNLGFSKMAICDYRIKDYRI